MSRENNRFCRNCYEYLRTGDNHHFSSNMAKLEWLEQAKPPSDQPVILSPLKHSRGRRKKELPMNYISQLINAGMGCKKIARKLKDERGVDCSYRTIARVVKGERK